MTKKNYLLVATEPSVCLSSITNGVPPNHWTNLCSLWSRTVFIQFPRVLCVTRQNYLTYLWCFSHPIWQCLTHAWCCTGTLDLHLRRDKDFDTKLLKNVPRESSFCLSALRESQQHSDTVFSSGNNTVTKVTVIWLITKCDPMRTESEFY